ncbi:54S ribosomal protein L23, mitochondrial [Lithohypha guttulata]|nr:54S ribosomal protein L23, mitochondrial [Lithohypha guttulata]
MSQSLGRTRLAYSRTWHTLNLSTDPRPLGRVATSIAQVLMGKNKPIYDPATDCGDYVVALNCAHIQTTGKKRQQKLYYTHNTKPGSLKSMSMDAMMSKWGGGEVLKKAVYEGEQNPYGKNLVRFAGRKLRPDSGIAEGQIVEAMAKVKIEEPPEKQPA